MRVKANLEKISIKNFYKKGLGVRMKAEIECKGMTAKAYLGQLDELDQKIKHKKQELADAKRRRGMTGRFGCPEVGRVQTSFGGAGGSQTESQAIRILALEEDIENRMIEYLEVRHQMIDQIHDLNDALFIDILYRRYVRNEKNLTQIAFDMGYSYKYIINKHGEALEAFEKTHPELFEAKSA